MGTAVIERGGGYVTQINDDYQIKDCNRQVIEVDATNKNIITKLPIFSSLAILASGYIFIKKSDNSEHKVTIQASDIDSNVTTIDNENNATIELLYQNDFVVLLFDDTSAVTGKYNMTIVSSYIQADNTHNGYITKNKYKEWNNKLNSLNANTPVDEIVFTDSDGQVKSSGLIIGNDGTNKTIPTSKNVEDYVTQQINNIPTATNSRLGLSKGDGVTISADNGVLSVIGGGGGGKYPTYNNYSELPTNATDKTIVLILTTSTILTNTYPAGLWQYNATSTTWLYLGINVDNDTLKYNNNILQANVGTGSNQLVQLDNQGDLPIISSENTTIGEIANIDSEIVSNDSIKTAMSKTQGQLNQKMDLMKNATSNRIAFTLDDGNVKDSGFTVQSSGGLSTSSTEIPTSEIVTNAIAYAITKPTSFMGTYDASTNVFPTTGSGTGGAIVAGDTWIISVAGTLGGTPVFVGNTIVAKFNNPEQYPDNWWIDPNPNIDSLNGLGGAVVIQGTNNQIIITLDKQNIVLSLPQNINTTADVEFSTVKVKNSNKQIKTSGVGSLTIPTDKDTISVTAKTIEAKKFLTAIGTDGTVNNAQPFFSDIINTDNLTKTEDFTATINTMYAVNSTNNVINIVCPATISGQTIPDNSLIFVVDVGNKANINNIFIKDTVGNVITTIKSNGQLVQLSYNGFNAVWQPISQFKINNTGIFINPIASTDTPLADQVVNWAYITSQYANLAPLNPLQIYVDGVYGSDTSGKGTVFSPFATITKGLTAVSGSGNILCNTANYTASLNITKQNVLITCYNNTNLNNFKYTQTANITISGTATRNSFQGMQFTTGSIECVTHISSNSIINFQNCAFITTNASIMTLGGSVTSNMFNNFFNWCDFTGSVSSGAYINLANNNNNTFIASFTINTVIISTTATLTAGQLITGTGIAVGTIILASIGTNLYAISQNTTATIVNGTLYKAIPWYFNNCTGLRLNIGVGHIVFATNTTLGENGVNNALIGQVQNYYQVSNSIITKVATYNEMKSLNFTNFGGLGYLVKVLNDTTLTNNGLWQCVNYPYNGVDGSWYQLTRDVSSLSVNIVGGSAGQIPYQSSANTTAFTGTGSSGQILQSNGNSAPTWVNKTSTPTASTIVTWDSNKNLNANNVITTSKNIITSLTQLVLTVASEGILNFTGSNNQPVKLPVASTLNIGWSLRVINSSTGTITFVLNDGLTTLFTLTANNSAFITATDISTTNGQWNYTVLSGLPNQLFTGKFWVGQNNVPTQVQMSQDATLDQTGALTISNNAVSNTKLSQMASMTIKMNNTSDIANPIDGTTNDAKTMLADTTVYQNYSNANNTYLLQTYQAFIVVRNNVSGTNNVQLPDGSSAIYKIVKGFKYTIVNSNQSATNSIINVIGAVTTIQLKPGESCQIEVDDNSQFQLVGQTTTGANYLSNFLQTGKIFMGNNANIATGVTPQGAISVKDAAIGEFQINNNQVTTNTINNNAVTLAKIETIASNTILGNNTANPAIPKALLSSEVLSLLNINQITQSYTINNPTAGTVLTKNQQLVIFTNAQTIQGCQLPDPTTTLGLPYFIYNDTSSTKLIQVSNNVITPTIVYANLYPGQNCVIQSDGTSYRTVVTPTTIGGWKTYIPQILGIQQDPIYSGVFIQAKYYVINNMMTILFTLASPSNANISFSGTTPYYLITMPNNYNIDTSVVVVPSAAYNFYDGTVFGNGLVNYGTGPYFKSNLIVLKSPSNLPFYSNCLVVQLSISYDSITQLQYWRPALYNLDKNMCLYFTVQIPVVPS